MARGGGPSARKRVTLIELLRWTYAQQQADVAVGRTLDAGSRGGSTSTDGIWTLMTMGGRIDGGSHVIWADRYPVHPDALAVHRAVMAMPRQDAELAIELGRTGMFPRPDDQVPRPCPAVPSAHVETGSGGRKTGGDRVGWAVIDGERTEYRLDVVAVVFELSPVWRWTAGNRMVLVGEREIRTECEVCPITWWPDPSWYRMLLAAEANWRGIALRLTERIKAVELVEHLLEG